MATQYMLEVIKGSFKGSGFYFDLLAKKSKLILKYSKAFGII